LAVAHLACLRRPASIDRGRAAPGLLLLILSLLCDPFRDETI
jgi:hypothetical protein